MGTEPQLFLHGLLAPGQQSEHDIRVVEDLAITAHDDFSNKSVLNAFTLLLNVILLNVHSLDTRSWLLTLVADTVQEAWIGHDRSRVEPVNIPFYEALSMATSSYLRYAHAARVTVRDLPRSIV